MGIPDLSSLQSPLPLLRDMIATQITTQSYENNNGFIAEVISDGDNQTIVFTTLYGTEHTITGIAKGYIPNVGNVPVALKKVEAASQGQGTVTGIRIGIL